MIHTTTGRYQRRHPILQGLLAVWWVLAAAAAQGALCPPAAIDEYATVDYVYDGDTVRLADGRHVRLLGINTPEMGRDGEPSQPFAAKARRALQGLLARHGERVGLQFDRERRDRYHRVLAHLYVGDGLNVQARLLQQGLATVLVVPPNTAATQCYQRVERRARAAGRGLWGHDRYQVVPVRQLSGDSRGYHLIKGRVSDIDRQRHGLRLSLGKRVSLYVADRDMPFLQPLDPQALPGRVVVARGWLHHRRGGGLFMRIRHKSALRLQEE